MIEPQEIVNVDFTTEPLNREYYQCTFRGCIFSDMRIGPVLFEECRFESCNFSLATMNNTSWHEVNFVECKMTGVNFMDCNKFTIAIGFERSILHYAVFSGLGMQGTVFDQCELHEADFSGTNLSRASFKACDLQRTVFHQTNLEKADFFTAFNYTINPTVNKLRKARFSAGGLEGLISHLGIEVVG